MAWWNSNPVPAPAPIQPMEQPGKGKLAAMIGGAAAAALVGLVAQWEGYSTKPHWDRIGKVWDVCYGDTHIELRDYTEEECRDLLAERLADYSGPVLKRNPEIKGHDPQVIAASSLSYNIGATNYRKSSVARLFSAGRWASACNAFRSWVFSNGKRIQGLANRREAERKICLRDIPAEYNR